MGRDQHRHALASKVTDKFQYFGDQLWVQGRGDFVQQKKPGAHGEGPDYSDTLLLATRKTVRVLGRLVRHADPAQQLPGALLRGTALEPEDTARSEGDVVKHVEVREEVERLEHHTGMAPHQVLVDAVISQVVAEQFDGPRVHPLEEVAAPEQGRLARPRSADEAHDLMGADRQIDAS
jgi:hypothetical protein